MTASQDQRLTRLVVAATVVFWLAVIVGLWVYFS